MCRSSHSRRDTELGAGCGLPGAWSWDHREGGGWARGAEPWACSAAAGACSFPTSVVYHIRSPLASRGRKEHDSHNNRGGRQARLYSALTDPRPSLRSWARMTRMGRGPRSHHWHGYSPCTNPAAQLLPLDKAAGVSGPSRAPGCRTSKGLLLKSNLSGLLRGSPSGGGGGHCCFPWCHERGTANPLESPGTPACRALPLGPGAQLLPLCR